MLAEVLGALLFFAGLLSGFFLKSSAAKPQPIDLNIGDLGLSCSHTKTFQPDDEEEEVDICVNKATVIRNGMSLCQECEENYIDNMLGNVVPDSPEGLDD